MKRPDHDEKVANLREQLRLRIDSAVKSVAEVLQAAADLFIATSQRKADEGIAIGEAEAKPIPEMLTPQQAADYLGVKVSTRRLEMHPQVSNAFREDWSKGLLPQGRPG